MFSIAVYTFEDASHLSAFTASGTSTLARSTTRYKDATHSMKWTWASGDSITHAFTSNVSNNLYPPVTVLIIVRFVTVEFEIALVDGIIRDHFFLVSFAVHIVSAFLLTA